MKYLTLLLLAACGPATAQRADLPIQISRDTAAIIRYGLDVSLAERTGVVVACYLTNPKRWKGPPSMACVAVPLPATR